jgi:hypothetical protein
VQLLEAFAPRLVGLHASEDTVGRPPPVTTPPAGETVIALAEGDVPRVLLTPIAVVVMPEAIVRFTTASVPFVIMPAFMPEATHV